MTGTIWVDLDDLSYWEDNPNEGDIGAIYQSIKQFGYNDVLALWHGEIKGGNHRIKALQLIRSEARQNGMSLSSFLQKSQALRMQNDQWQVQALDVSHLQTEAEADAYALALNRTARLGRDDPKRLLSVIDRVKEVQGELIPAAGYDEEVLRQLAIDAKADIPPVADPGAQINRADELQKIWQVERGQIWEIPSMTTDGSHRVMCGDSTDESDVARLMDGGKADAVVTDPPYGIKRDKGFEGFGGFGTPIVRTQYTGNWDLERPTAQTFKLILSYAPIALIFGGNFFADILPAGNHWIVWDKLNTMPTFGDCELIWTNIARNSVKKIVFQYNGLVGKEKERYHATQKPVGLLTEIIKGYTDDNNIVLDPFLGSGTTIVACEQTGRIGRGMEIHPPYVSVSLQRLKDMGLEPRIAND